MCLAIELATISSVREFGQAAPAAMNITERSRTLSAGHPSTLATGLELERLPSPALWLYLQLLLLPRLLKRL